MIERRRQHGSRLLGQTPADGLAVLAQPVVGNDLRPVSPRRLDLRARSVVRHHNRCRGAGVPSGDRRGLRMIAGRKGNHTACPLLLAQRKDQVGRAAYLERPAGLKVLALEPCRDSGALVEQTRGENRRPLGDRRNPPRRLPNIVDREAHGAALSTTTIVSTGSRIAAGSRRMTPPAISRISTA